MAKARKKPAKKKSPPKTRAKKAAKPKMKKKAAPKKMKAAPKKRPALKKTKPASPPAVKKAPSPRAAAQASVMPAGPKPLAVPPIQPIVPEEHEVPRVRTGPGEVAPAFDLLPEWVDRSHLHEVMQSGGLAFTSPAAGFADHTEAQRLLSGCRPANTSLPAYFLICAKENGKVVGAMDCYAVGDVLVLLRSFAASEKRRDLHVLMYGCALGVARPAYVAMCIERPDFSGVESAGRLVLIGRGFAMSALPFAHQKMLFFLRRMGREYDPLSSGQELARIARAIKPLCPEAESAAEEISQKGVVPLVLMPSSPDRLERLRELRDASILLDLPAENLDGIFAELEEQYVRSRRDITPDAL